MVPHESLSVAPKSRAWHGDPWAGVLLRESSPEKSVKEGEKQDMAGEGVKMDIL